MSLWVGFLVACYLGQEDLEYVSVQIKPTSLMHNPFDFYWREGRLFLSPSLMKGGIELGANGYYMGK